MRTVRGFPLLAPAVSFGPYAGQHRPDPRDVLYYESASLAATGESAPTDSEVTVCLPFLVRHIELVQPKMLLLVGGLAAKNLFARFEGDHAIAGDVADVGESQHIRSDTQFGDISPSLSVAYPYTEKTCVA